MNVLRTEEEEILQLVLMILVLLHWLSFSDYHKDKAGQQDGVLFVGNMFVNNQPACGMFDNGTYSDDLSGTGDGSRLSKN